MIFVFLVATVPLLFLLRFFGGVEIELILSTFAITATFAFFLASVSIFFSTVMRQARSAITMTYLAMIGILVAPLFASYAVPGSTPTGSPGCRTRSTTSTRWSISGTSASSSRAGS